jgi:hypothetical protein
MQAHVKTIVIAATTLIVGVLVGSALFGPALLGPALVPTPAAASAARGIVAFSGFETGASTPFQLAGDYSVEWTNSMAVATFGAPFVVRLMAASGDVAPDLLVNTAHDAGAAYSGQALIRNRHGTFYLDVLGGGLWTLTLRPIAAAP